MNILYYLILVGFCDLVLLWQEIIQPLKHQNTKFHKSQRIFNLDFSIILIHNSRYCTIYETIRKY